MEGPRSRLIDGKKYMWDGKEYENLEEAEQARTAYQADDFEVQVLEDDGTICVYTRRIVTEVEVEGPPP